VPITQNGLIKRLIGTDLNLGDTQLRKLLQKYIPPFPQKAEVMAEGGLWKVWRKVTESGHQHYNKELKE
jgi:hypothetical protein